jgi:hypothetical protein
VRRNSKSSFSRPRRKRRGGWRWLLALAVLAAAAWFWWRHEHPTKVVHAPTKAVAPRLRPFIIDPESPADFPRPVRDVFEAQVALARRGFRRVRLTPRPARKRARRFRFFRKYKTCPRPACSTRTRVRGSCSTRRC